MSSVTHYVFMDQHKKTSVVGIGDAQGHPLRKFDIDHGAKGVSRLKKELGALEGNVVVGLEATGFYDWMVDVLQGLGVEVKLGHPLAMKYISKAKNKTDGKDVERGLKLLGTEQFPEAYLPTPPERELRWLLTVREGFMRMRTQLRNRIRALLARKNIGIEADLETKASQETLRKLELPALYQKTLQELMGALEELSRRQKELDGQIKEEAGRDELTRWWDEHVGIGPQTALALRAYVAEPGRFVGRKRIASYLGLTPRVHNSAETIRQGSIDRQGPPILRRLLVEVAYIVVRKVKEADEYFDFLKRRIGGKRAIVAIARKLIVGLHAARRHQVKFDPARCFAIPQPKKTYVLKPVP